jgi:hypothetical protein
LSREEKSECFLAFFERLCGSFDQHEQLVIVLDIVFVIYVYFLAMVEWENKDKDAHPASAG